MRDKKLHSGERQVGPTLNHIEISHRWRYEEASSYVMNKTVLDIGCGIGYGSSLLAKTASLVYAIDDSIEAIEYAKQHYQVEKVCFDCMDVLGIYKGFVSCDVVVAFEIIEHIPLVDDLFKIFKLLSPELFIISTPHLKCPIGGNKFHHKHFGMDELVERFWDIEYKPLRAELLYFGLGLNNFMVMERKTA